MSTKGKQYVFSARTTAEGLETLNGLKARLGVGWDRLVIDAVNAHYGVEVQMPTTVGPTPEERAKARAEREAEKAEVKKAKADRKPGAEKKPKAGDAE